MDDAKRKEEMLSMRHDEGMTNNLIGMKFGVSRQRVCQIIGNTGRNFRKEWTRKTARETDISDMTRGDIKDLPGIAQVWERKFARSRHRVSGGPVEAGVNAENIVSDILSEKGIINKPMPFHSPFDILLDNGLRVEVKSASKKISPKSQNGYSYYNINIRKLGRGDYADFFAILIEQKTLFIIPSSEFNKSCSHVRIFWPRNTKTSKWEKYINRFDLLKQPKGATK